MTTNNVSSSSSSGGIGVLGLLGVALVVLKLTGVIDWSWWWVTAPFWGGFAIFAAFSIIFLLGALLVTIFSGDPAKKADKRRKADAADRLSKTYRR
jgi:phosphoglycerol transferase MdoB-like AlkP superfamily enzyme